MLVPALVLVSLAGCDPPPCPAAEQELPRALDAARLGRASACELAALTTWVQNRKTTHGPWNQDIGVARSADGLDWTAARGNDGLARPVLETAAVPEAVEGPDGRVWLFFVDGNLDQLLVGAADPGQDFERRGLPGVGALGAAVSTDGITFDRVPAHIEGLRVGMFADPEVVPVPGGGWRMYFLAMSVGEYTTDARWTEGERHEIHSAVSTDLVNWRSEGMVLRGPFADPAVACFAGGGCTMFSFGLDTSYSADGVRFVYAGPWQGVKGFAPDARSASPTEATVSYNDAAMGAPLRARRTIDGGHTWSELPGVSLDIYGEAVSTLRRRDGTWWMYFHTFKPGKRLSTVPDPPSP